MSMILEFQSILSDRKPTHFCAWCSRWFDQDWNAIQSSEKPQTHGMCPGCYARLEAQLQQNLPPAAVSKHKQSNQTIGY